MESAIALPEATPGTLRNVVIFDTRPERVQHMTPEELVVVQSRLGYGDKYGFWITPPKWLPPGHRNESKLQVDFRKRLNSFGVSDHEINNAVLYYTRYAVLMAMTPCSLGTRGAGMHLKPHTLHRAIYQIVPHLVGTGAIRANANGQYVHALCSEDFENCSATRNWELRNELNRMHMFCDLGLWPDRPSIGVAGREKDFTPAVAGDDVRPQHESKSNKYKPLPDDWLAEASWRVLWMVRDLGPNVLTLGRQLTQIVREHPIFSVDGYKVSAPITRKRKAYPLLAAHRWVDRHGHDIVMPPFPLTLRPGKRTPNLNPGQWPPTHVPHILMLLKHLQSAHLFIALLSVGSRISEMLSLETGSITRSSDGTPFANGMTFKLTQLLEGKERDWSLPDVALEAIEQQEALRDIFIRIGRWQGDATDDEAAITDSLWLRYGTIDEPPAVGVGQALRSLVASLGLTSDPGDQYLSTHRFRKTIARLVALAVVGAPKILMDLFGHKSIEMTLDYILTDPDIAAEAKKISEEMVIMRATTAIEKIDDYGGKAAKSIKRMVERERCRLGKDLGAENIRELAEILTMNGQAWELSRPGVICTKLPGSPSPCAKKVGHPEPSRCISDCDNRLEEAFLRKDVDGAIAESIQHYEAERDADNPLMQDFWAGQILTHLNRFDDLQDKWSAHSSVMEILGLVEQSA